MLMKFCLDEILSFFSLFLVCIKVLRLSTTAIKYIYPQTPQDKIKHITRKLKDEKCEGEEM